MGHIRSYIPMAQDLRVLRTVVLVLAALFLPTAGGASQTAQAGAPEITCDAIPPSACDTTVVAMLRDDYGVGFSANNRVVLFKRGTEKFADLFCAIRQARHSIHCEYFNFRNDSISKALFTLLAEKAAEGVEVRVLFDGFGNSSNNRPLRRSHLKRLRASGIEIYEFDPVRFPWFNHVLHRDHRKIVVIDGCVAYTGGMNVADYYLKGKPEFGEWRDIHARVEGDAVGKLQAVFIGFWNKVTGQDVSGSQYYPGTRDAARLFSALAPDTCSTSGHKYVAVVDRTPGRSDRIIHDTFVKAIDGARSQIQIINPYFTLCGHIRRALIRAARRGVDVEVMLSAKSDIPITPRIVEYNAHKLMEQGVNIYFFEGGFHHSKIMMVDSLYAFIGSANLNSRSLSFDYECNLLVADRPTTATLQRIFETDKVTRCFKLTPQTWRKMSLWRRFSGWLFHFLAPVVIRDSGDSERLGDFHHSEPLFVRNFLSCETRHFPSARP